MTLEELDGLPLGAVFGVVMIGRHTKEKIYGIKYREDDKCYAMVAILDGTYRDSWSRMSIAYFRENRYTVQLLTSQEEKFNVAQAIKLRNEHTADWAPTLDINILK